MKLYYAQEKTFAESNLEHSPQLTVLTMFPKAAMHGEFYVVGAAPKNFDGETLDLYLAGLDETGENGATHAQFKSIVDNALAQEFTGKLIIMTKAQGKWLEANHPAFMSAGENELVN